MTGPAALARVASNSSACDICNGVGAERVRLQAEERERETL